MSIAIPNSKPMKKIYATESVEVLKKCHVHTTIKNWVDDELKAPKKSWELSIIPARQKRDLFQ